MLLKGNGQRIITMNKGVIKTSKNSNIIDKTIKRKVNGNEALWAVDKKQS